MLVDFFNSIFRRDKYLRNLEEKERQRKFDEKKRLDEIARSERLKIINDYMTGKPKDYANSVKQSMNFKISDSSYNFTIPILIKDYHSERCNYIYQSIHNEINRPKGAVDFYWDVYTITFKNEIYIGITTDYSKRIHTQPKVKRIRELGEYIVHYQQLPAAYAGTLEKLLIKYYSSNKSFKCRNVNPGGEFGKWGVFIDENDPRNSIDNQKLISLKESIIEWVNNNAMNYQ